MDPFLEYKQAMTRRHFFGRSACGLGAAALGSCLNPSLFANDLAGGGILDVGGYPVSLARLTISRDRPKGKVSKRSSASSASASLYRGSAGLCRERP